jgi:HEAT repeat protein
MKPNASLFFGVCGILGICAVIAAAKKYDDLYNRSLEILKSISLRGSIEAKAASATIWPLISEGYVRDELRRLLEEPNHEIMAQAALALKTLGDSTGKTFLETVLEEQFRVPEQAAQLEKFKRYSQFRFRKISAAETLGAVGDGTSIGVLKQLRSETPDGQIRDACSTALAQLGEPGEVIVFENAAAGLRDIDIRKTALRSLAIIAKPSSVPVLKKLMDDKSSVIRAAAVNALGKIGQKQILLLCGLWSAH